MLFRSVWIQDDLFADEEPDAEEALEAVLPELPATRTTYAPGMDVLHEVHGQGWVWGSGRGVVTVRFETAETGPGRVMSFAIDDPALSSLHRPRR